METNLSASPNMNADGVFQYLFHHCLLVSEMSATGNTSSPAL